MRTSIIPIFLLCWSVVSGETNSAVTADVCANGGVLVDGVYHDTHVIKNITTAMNLIVDRKTNTLFFNYVSGPAIGNLKIGAAYIDLNTESFGDIAGLPTGMGTAVDQTNGAVYFGSSEGIYTYNYTTKYTTPYGTRGKQVYSMFYKEKLYFIEYPTYKLYAMSEDGPELVPEFENFEPRLYTIDSNDQAMYVNMSGLFGLKKGDGIDKLKYYRSNFLFSGAALNAIGKPFFSGNLGIYALGEDNVLKVIVDVDEVVHGFSFDKDDNIIYSAGNQIVKLTRSNKLPC